MIAPLLRLTTHAEEAARQAEHFFDYDTTLEWGWFTVKLAGALLLAVGMVYGEILWQDWKAKHR